MFVLLEEKQFMRAGAQWPGWILGNGAGVESDAPAML